MSTPSPATPRVGQSFVMVNDLYTFRATSVETGGSYVLIDSIVPPGGGPPPHIHTRETEVFVVIEGRITCTESGASRTLGPGECITLRPHKAHTFRNNTDKPARMLVICLPAAIESMFAAAGVLVAPGTRPGPARAPTAEELAVLGHECEKAGIRFVDHA